MADFIEQLYRGVQNLVREPLMIGFLGMGIGLIGCFLYSGISKWCRRSSGSSEGK